MFSVTATMATPESGEEIPRTVAEEEEDEFDLKNLTKSFLGLSFSVMLACLPSDAMALLPRLTSEVKDLRWRLAAAEDQLRQMKYRRVEDSKANARVVEIFASHRNAWQEEEKRLLQRIEAAEQEAYSMTAKIHDLEQERVELLSRAAELEREVGERDEMIGFMSRKGMEDEGEESTADHRLDVTTAADNGISDFIPSLGPTTNRFWTESASNNSCQEVQYDYDESMYSMKHFIPRISNGRRETPWKVERESSGISAKLSVIEDELLNLEKGRQCDISKVPLLLRKLTNKYQALASNIHDLCLRMESSDPCEATLSSEFRTQRQTEFLLECFRFQQRASESGQKLVSLQTEITKSYQRDQNQSNEATRSRSLDSIKNNLKQIQRDVEIWLARIIGNLEGILARDGASRVRDFYVSRYPFLQ